MYSEYSDKVFEHFMSPYNAYSMPDCDASGEHGDSHCGDTLTMYIKVKNNILTEVSYLVFGCPTSIATSSMTATLAEGKTLDEAMHLTEDDIAMALDGLPEDKMHCSNLGITALKNAINNYNKVIK